MTKTDRTFLLLLTDWTTSLECALNGGVLSLSQRVGDFRRRGYAVEEKSVTTQGGARVLAWRIVQDGKQ